MSDTDILLRRDAQQQFTQSDLDQIAAAQHFDEQELMFIENLNVDVEEEEKQKKPVAQESITIQQQPEKQKEESLDDLKRYVLKCVSRQDISPNFAAIEFDFYDKVRVCVSEMTENSYFRMESFINTRLERIIMYSKSFSQNVCMTLTKEERELYTDLCKSVNKYREKMDEMMNIEK
jgi:hypothetical protein